MSINVKEMSTIVSSSFSLCVDDVVRCLAGIRCSEMQAYFYVLNGARTAEELATKIDRNRSTAQRMLTNLLAQGFVRRQTSTTKGPGYVYEYVAIPAEDVKEMLRARLEQLYERLNKFLEEEWDRQVKEFMERGFSTE